MTPDLSPDLSVIPRRPGDAESPVFREPWEAQAFAMTVLLHQRGVFTWVEWAEALAKQIALAQTQGDARSPFYLPGMIPHRL